MKDPKEEDPEPEEDAPEDKSDGRRSGGTELTKLLARMDAVEQENARFREKLGKDKKRPGTGLSGGDLGKLRDRLDALELDNTNLRAELEAQGHGGKGRGETGGTEKEASGFWQGWNDVLGGGP